MGATECATCKNVSPYALKLRLLVLLTAVLVATHLCGCSYLFRSSENAPQVIAPTFLQAESSSPRGVFVVVHGLNLNPEVMEPLSHHLRSLGFHVYRVVLSGHRERFESEEAFTEAAWQADLDEAYAAVRSHYPELPVYVLGYSLGGLLSADFVLRQSDAPVQKMILIAPALSLRTVVEVAGVLTWLPGMTVEVPNLAPREYRRFSTTPLFWYQNTLSLYGDEKWDEDLSKLASVETLVFLNPRDELVSWKGTEAWIASHELQSIWEVQVVRPRSKALKTFEHLMIDEQSLGEEVWGQMKGRIAEFLE